MIKGLKRKDGGKLSPSGEEWGKMRSAIERAQFSVQDDKKRARFVINALSRYNSGSAWVQLELMTEEGRAELGNILKEVGFEVDIPKE